VCAQVVRIPPPAFGSVSRLRKNYFRPSSAKSQGLESKGGLNSKKDDHVESRGFSAACESKVLKSCVTTGLMENLEMDNLSLRDRPFLSFIIFHRTRQNSILVPKLPQTVFPSFTILPLLRLFPVFVPYHRLAVSLPFKVGRRDPYLTRSLASCSSLRTRSIYRSSFGTSEAALCASKYAALRFPIASQSSTLL